MMVALYSRVSTQDQAKEGYSIGEQNERLKAYAAAMGWTVYKSYVDPAFSGANTNRPALQEMIKDIQAGHIRKVVVYKLDRLSRSQLDILYLIEKVFLANGCDFVSMSENFDTSSPFGRAMIGILAVFAQLEREQIKERMKMGMDARAKTGRWHGGGYVPTGYRRTPDGLVADEYEAMQVRELFKLYNQGVGVKHIEKLFAEKGYTTQHGKWNAKTMNYVLSNPMYIGYIKHTGDLIRGIHEPLIDEATYNKAQTTLIRNRNQQAEMGYKPGTVAGAYLTGLLYCVQCGGKYSKVTGSAYRYHYYYCYSRHKKTLAMVKNPNCKNKSWRMEELDNIVFDEIKKLALDPDAIKPTPTSSEDTAEKRKALIREIASIDTQLSRLLDLYALGRFSVEQLDKKTAALTEQRDALQKSLNAMQGPYRLPVDDARQIISSFADVLQSGSFDDIRAVLLALIQRIDLDDDKVTIRWAF